MVTPRRVSSEPRTTDITSLKLRALLSREWMTLRWERGDSVEEMAQEAGCGVSTIHHRVKRFGLPAREVREARRDLDEVLTPEVLEDMYVTQRMTLSKIAAEVGCSTTTVGRRLEAAGIPRRRRQAGVDNIVYPELDAEVLASRLEAGETYHELAAEFGCSTQAIALAIRRAGMADRLPGVRRPLPLCAPPEELRRLYVEEKLSMDAIGARFGTTRMKVRADLDRAGIRPYKRKRGRHRRADAHEG